MYVGGLALSGYLINSHMITGNVETPRKTIQHLIIYGIIGGFGMMYVLINKKSLANDITFNSDDNVFYFQPV